MEELNTHRVVWATTPAAGDDLITADPQEIRCRQRMALDIVIGENRAIQVFGLGVERGVGVHHHFVAVDGFDRGYERFAVR